MRPIYFTQTYATADDNGIALSQAMTANVPLVLAGALVVGGVGVLGDQRFVALASTDDLSLVDFTIIGYDQQGRFISEVMAGPNNDSVNSLLSYSRVISITPSATNAGAVIAGTSVTGDGPPLPLDIYVPNSRTTISVDFPGGAGPDVSIEFTNDNPYGDQDVAMQGYTVPTPDPHPWFPHPDTDLATVAVDTYGFTDVPMRAVRVVRNSGAGAVRVIVTQQSTQ